MKDDSLGCLAMIAIIVGAFAFFNIDLNPFNNVDTVYYENRACTQNTLCERFVRITIVAIPETQSVIYSLNDGAGPQRWNNCIVMNIDNWNCNGAPISMIDDTWTANSDDYEISWGISWSLKQMF